MKTLNDKLIINYPKVKGLLIDFCQSTNQLFVSQTKKKEAN